jgi:hypothetical protein
VQIDVTTLGTCRLRPVVSLGLIAVAVVHPPPPSGLRPDLLIAQLHDAAASTGYDPSGLAVPVAARFDASEPAEAAPSEVPTTVRRLNHEPARG